MELTVENVFRLLDSRNYTVEYLTPDNSNPPTKKFNLQDYTDTMKLLMDSFWPGYRIKQFDNNTVVGGPVTTLNNQYHNIIFKDVTRLDIHNLYSHTIYKLNNVMNKNQDIDPFNEEEWDTVSLFKNRLVWNIEQFPVLFNFLFDSMEIIKSMDETVYKLLRYLFNFTWGAINNNHSLIKCLNCQEIMNTIINVENNLYESFSKHVIYINVDSIYFSAFPEIDTEVSNKLNELGYDFSLTQFKNFLPINRRDYVTSDFELKSRGLKIIPNLREHLENREIVLNKKIEGFKESNGSIELSKGIKWAAQTIGLDLVEVKQKKSRVEPQGLYGLDDYDLNFDLPDIF